MKKLRYFYISLLAIGLGGPSMGTMCAMEPEDSAYALRSVLQWVEEDFPPKHSFRVVWRDGWRCDRELNSMELADRAKALGICGFQGCVNKEQCHNYGCYLQEYSPEGLCRECEFKLYPERYGACLFCDALVRKSRTDIRFVCCRNCLKELLK